MQQNLGSLDTLAFVKEYLPAGSSILEVGCGKGDLALELMRAGYQILGIDLNSAAISAAKEKGVDATVGDVMEYETTKLFDAVLFNRVLHHFPALDPVMLKVKSLLAEKGRILVDDFAIEQMDEPTAEWFYEFRDLCAAFSGHESKSNAAPLERWKTEHHHDPALLTKSIMLRDVGRRFENPYEVTVPYLYRYFADNLGETSQRAAIVQQILESEKKRIACGQIRAIGFRLVAKKYFSYLL